MTGVQYYALSIFILFLLGIVPQIYLRLRRHRKNSRLRNRTGTSNIHPAGAEK